MNRGYYLRLLRLEETLESYLTTLLPSVKYFMYPASVHYDHLS